MPPGPPLLAKDDQAGVDQAAWLHDRMRQLAPSIGKKPIARVGRDLAEEFEAHFPIDVVYHKANGKLETRPEWSKRTHNRKARIAKHVETHWKEVVAGPPVRARAYLLDSRAAMEVRSTRAKSARDLFVADHPDINHNTRQQLKADGVTDVAVVQKAVNDAYSAAIEAAKSDGTFGTYEAASAAEKEAAAAVRASKVEELDVQTSGGDRALQLQNLQYTLETNHRQLADLTHTAIVTIYAGLDSEGKPMKWILSSEEGHDDDILPQLSRLEVSGFHEVFDEWVARRFPPMPPPSVGRGTTHLATPEHVADSPRPPIVRSTSSAMSEPCISEPATAPAVVHEQQVTDLTSNDSTQLVPVLLPPPLPEPREAGPTVGTATPVNCTTSREPTELQGPTPPMPETPPVAAAPEIPPRSDSPLTDLDKDEEHPAKADTAMPASSGDDHQANINEPSVGGQEELSGRRTKRKRIEVAPSDRSMRKKVAVEPAQTDIPARTTRKKAAAEPVLAQQRDTKHGSVARGGNVRGRGRGRGRK